MQVHTIMTREVITVGPDDSVRGVRDLFERFRFHHVIVVDAGRVAGVVSDRDLLKNLSPFIGKGSERPMDLASLQRRVHQIMTRKPITINENDAIGAAGLLMLQNHVSCLPVVNDAGACCGIITSRDVLRWCLQSGCSVMQQKAA
jgi:acetoin utilization protein AcuB